MLNNKKFITGIVASNRQIKEGHFLMCIKLSPEFPAPQPGQFLMVRMSERSDPFLGRPLSVYGFLRRRKDSLCEILYRVQGKGTALLSKIGTRVAVSIHGPLGRSFELKPGDRNIVLIAGGMGIAPLTFLAAHLASVQERKDAAVTGYVGGKTGDQLVAVERLAENCDVRIATDDGSLGFGGFVTDLFRRDMAQFDPADTAIFACGPRPMMKVLAGLLAGTDFRCQVSLEERMACGVGVCLGCVTAVRSEDGKIKYRRVCKEGPVFDIREVIWE